MEQHAYFEKFLKRVPDNILVISLSFCAQRENIICLNACFDNFVVVKLTKDLLKEAGLPITLIFPECGRHTLSQMIYLSENPNLKIYAGKCTPILLNPNLITTLNDIFNINGLTSVKKDMEKIIIK